MDIWRTATFSSDRVRALPCIELFELVSRCDVGLLPAYVTMSVEEIVRRVLYGNEPGQNGVVAAIDLCPRCDQAALSWGTYIRSGA